MASDRILVVEDALFFSKLLKQRIESVLGIGVVCAATRTDALAHLGRDPKPSLALVDLGLPDAPNGEVAKDALNHQVPTIIFTSTFDEKLREQALWLGAIDYILKDSPSSIEYVVNLIRRILKNRRIKALVADDSPTARRQVARQLSTFQFQVMEAPDGPTALRLIAENPDIKLGVLDYQMPQMDGFVLASTIRRQFPERHIALVGISAEGNPLVSARFIKSGANDFIRKPFSSEELLCRISQNMELLETIEELEWAAAHDHLTQLNNRRQFFKLARALLHGGSEGGEAMALAMIDIDHFKQINDNYGHDVGDLVLRHLAEVMESHFPAPAVVARFGGEEFCVLLKNLPPKACADSFESLRARIEREPAIINGEPLRVTVSIGIHYGLCTSLDDMLTHADSLLYASKDGGRNRITQDHPPP